jgi:hypothetical protein
MSDKSGADGDVGKGEVKKLKKENRRTTWCPQVGQGGARNFGRLGSLDEDGGPSNRAPLLPLNWETSNPAPSARTQPSTGFETLVEADEAALEPKTEAPTSATSTSHDGPEGEDSEGLKMQIKELEMENKFMQSKLDK